MPSILPRPGVGCVLMTDRLTSQSARWFAEVKRITDEMVIFVDIARADEATRSFAEALATTLHFVEGRGYIEPHLREMFRACQCEWILRLDTDEELSASWYTGEWRDRLGRSACSHYQIPRRWLHPAGGYIDCEPWWRDPQARLFRNAPDRIVFPQLLHEPMRAEGEAGELPGLIINHHALEASRSQREAKVRRYTQIRPEQPLGHYYLFEDAVLTTAPLPNNDSTPQYERALLQEI